jgi:hypothetical protein
VDTQTDTQTLLLYDTHRIENGASNNYPMLYNYATANTTNLLRIYCVDGCITIIYSNTQQNANNKVSSSIVACTRSGENVFVEPLPSIEQRDTINLSVALQ